MKLEKGTFSKLVNKDENKNPNPAIDSKEALKEVKKEKAPKKEKVKKEKINKEKAPRKDKQVKAQKDAKSFKSIVKGITASFKDDEDGNVNYKEMKLKPRKLGIALKLIIPSIVIIIFVCVLISIILTQRSKSSMVQIGGQVAQSVAVASTGKFNAFQIEGLIKNGEKGADIDLLRGNMDAILESYDVINLYIIGYNKDTGETYYALSSSNDTSKPYGTPFEYGYDYIASVYENQETLADGKMTKKADGNVITAYAPFVKDDTVVAVLACDYDAKEIKAETSKSSMMSIIISIVCAILSSVLVTILVNTVVKNLNKVNRKVYEVASNEGDLTQTIKVKSGDETELIANNFNVLLDYIRTIMLSIDSNVDSLRSSSAQIVGNLNEANANITDITATMDQMNVAMNNTTESIDMVASEIQEMNNQIEDIHNQAIEGSNTTIKISHHAVNIRDKAVESKKNAIDETDKMAESMRDKIERSKEVSQIDSLTQQILAIANQTRLLSLNASIEAARAGEAGRGFSVVAEEIGKLANESGSAAGRIKQVSETVVAAVTELAEEAEKMVAFLNEVTLNGFEELEKTGFEYSKDAEKLSALMTGFAEVSEKLRGYSDNIQNAMDAVNVAAQDTSTGVSNVIGKTSQMAEQIYNIENDAMMSETVANKLGTEVNKFKLN